MSLRELRLLYVCRDPTAPTLPSLKTPHEAASLFASVLGNEAVEVFGAVYVTTKQDVICYHEISRGTLNATMVHPREVFKPAVLGNAAAVIVGHNHPSGEPEPSVDDERLTARLVAAGVLLGIDVLDHVIVGSENRYYSFRESGAI
jgi:DNA repair protein RadC